jgi:hypothetical protein
MRRACGTYREKEKYIQVLVGKHNGRRPLGRNRCRWEDNIKMYLERIGWKGVD